MENKQTTVSLQKFAYLLLASLANNSKIIDLNNRLKRIASLPTNYKQIIENILCADNGWKDEFSVLINIEEYFLDHFEWERNLGKSIEVALGKLRKNINFDFELDRLLITFTEEEIDKILNSYDKEFINTLNHFASLLTDYIYTREFAEEFYDYNASSVQKMRAQRQKENEITLRYKQK